MDSFIEALEEYAPKSVCVVHPSGGNHGDTLILRGICKKLSDLNVNFNVEYYRYFSTLGKIFIPFRHIDFDKYDLIILRGGGYINDVWRHGSTILADLARNASNIIVAPQSFWLTRKKPFIEIYLKGIDANIQIFAREKYSFEALKKCRFASNVEVKLSQDSSFYLDKKDLIDLINHDFINQNGQLICFRQDNESKRYDVNRLNIPQAQNRLLSKVATLEEYLSAINEASSIYTDRLHIAIAGSILGKKVYLYSNTYWKNRGVYEYSLVKYPNTKFVEVPN